MNIKFNYSNNNNTTRINAGTNNVPYISFSKLDETGMVINGFSTRLGGVSTNHLESLNLGYTRGDEDDNVTQNHMIIAEALGFDYCDMVTTNQTHTTNVRIVTESDKGKGIIIPRDYSNVDGLITNIKNIPLVTYYADCVPLYFLDIQNKTIGLSHSGWRGTVNKMGLVTVNLMKEHFGTNPDKVIACIGPSICQKCYEVGAEVAEAFMKAFEGNEGDILICKANGKYQLNLWNANKLVFLEAGIPEENIAVTDICTCCNKELLFSHRGHNGMRGNMGAFLMLK